MVQKATTAKFPGILIVPYYLAVCCVQNTYAFLQLKTLRYARITGWARPSDLYRARCKVIGCRNCRNCRNVKVSYKLCFRLYGPWSRLSLVLAVDNSLGQSQISSAADYGGGELLFRVS